MKIAYYVSNRNTFPPDSNQVAASITVVTNIINHLKKRHQITLYAAKGSKMEGVEIIDLNMLPFIMDSSLGSSDWITKAAIGLKQIPIGKMFEDASQYDIIHIHSEPVYLAMPYVNLIKTPVLFTSHNAVQPFEKPIFNFYDGKVNLSALSKKQASLFGWKNNVPVLNNGIEVDDFCFNSEAKNYFLFLGRLVKDKGIDVFLELAKSLRNVEFYIAGKGDANFEKICEDYAKKYKNIKYFGMVPRGSEKWRSLLSDAKALIMPIQYEDTFPLVPLEAMAFGTPVIGFDRGALPEQIENEKTGIVVSSKKQLTGMKDAVKYFDSMPSAQYKTMRKQSRARVEAKFNTKIMAQNYENLYKNIIKNHKRGNK